MSRILTPLSAARPGGPTPRQRVRAIPTPAAAAQIDWQARVLRVQQAAAQADDPRLIALAACRAIAAEIGAEQVAIAWRRGRELRVLTAAPTRASQLGPRRSRALLLAMNEACDQQVSLSSHNPQGPAHIVLAQRALAAGLRDPDTLVISVPLPRETRPVGALTVCLRGAAARLAIEFHDRLLAMLEQLAPMLAQPLSLSEVARWPLARRLHWRWQRSAQRRRRRRGGAIALATAVALLLAVPLPRTLSSDARIQGAIERQVASPAPGTLAKVLVRPGDEVREGDTLAILTDRDLLLERDRLLGELAEHRSQADASMARGERADMAIARSRLEQTHAELTRLEARLAEAQVKAPIDGVVLDGDLWQSVGTPVERGQPLFTIAPVAEFRATIDIEESDRVRAGVGQRGQLRLQALDGEPLPFTITRIAPITLARQDKIVFEAQARLDDPPATLRAGMSGIAQLDGGHASLLGRWSERALRVLRESWWRWQP
ncbi:MAG: HlyD family efflux transporter periplasmic adaptor subunit [Burkholderiaceae bacterium]